MAGSSRRGESGRNCRRGPLERGLKGGGTVWTSRGVNSSRRVLFYPRGGHEEEINGKAGRRTPSSGCCHKGEGAPYFLLSVADEQVGGIVRDAREGKYRLRFQKDTTQIPLTQGG